MRFTQDEVEKYSVKRGDILICEGGYPGRAAIWQNDYDIMFQKALHRVRFINSCFSSYLFVQLLWLWDQTRQIDKLFTGSGINHLTSKSLNKLLLPLPPLAEQQAIVARVEHLLSLCDQLDTQITTSHHHATSLLQSILQEAFAGG